MENIKEITNELTGELHIIIEHADGSFTSMAKATYDEQKANEAETI